MALLEVKDIHVYYSHWNIQFLCQTPCVFKLKLWLERSPYIVGVNIAAIFFRRPEDKR